MKYVAFLSAVLVSVLSPVATAYNPSITPTVSRRQLLQRTAVIGGFAFLAPLTQFPQPSLANTAEDIELIKSARDLYKSALKDKATFVADLAAENSSTKIPQQPSAITFQNLAKVAHNVGEKLDADDFPFVAVEYAEHAGAARDFAKLSKLGRIGENGSAEVALAYAEKCVEELEEASVLLDTLCQALE
jgi:hypothetical protein